MPADREDSKHIHKDWLPSHLRKKLGAERDTRSSGNTGPPPYRTSHSTPSGRQPVAVTSDGRHLFHYSSADSPSPSTLTGEMPRTVFTFSSTSASSAGLSLRYILAFSRP